MNSYNAPAPARATHADDADDVDNAREWTRGEGGGGSGGGSGGGLVYSLSPPEQVRADLEHTFARCDETAKGYLDRTDLKVACVYALGYKPSKLEIQHMFERVGAQDVQRLTRSQFIAVMTLKIVQQDPSDYFRQLFEAFDVHHRGFLVEQDLIDIFATVAPEMPISTVQAAFREVDTDTDGRVSYREFDRAMRSKIHPARLSAHDDGGDRAR